MAKPNSRQSLIDYCLRKLGAPVLEINVADEQIDDAVDDALQLFHERHFDGVARTFLKYQITSDDKDRGRAGPGGTGITSETATSTAGHDRVIDEILTEIKFSLATRDKKGGAVTDKFIINHVSVSKDWERLIFCGINPDESEARIVFFTKEDFVAHLESDDCLFNVQQGGKKGGNDDYICTNVAALLECDFVRPITQWN